MPDEIKTLVEDINKSFQEFKTKNDQRLTELEKQRRDDPLLKNQVDALIKETLDLDEIKTVKERMAEIETKLNRPAFETQDTDDPKKVDVKMARDKLHAEGAAKLSEPERKALKREAMVKYIRTGDDDEVKALAVEGDPQGGYWVTPEMSDRVVLKVFETSPMRAEATIETITSDALEVPDDLNEPGGGWTEETGDRAETGTPDVGLKRIPVHELYANPKATQRVLDDASIDIEGWLATKTAEKLTRLENTAFVTGSGNGRPRGILDYTAGTDLAKEQIEQINSGNSSQVTADGLRALFYALKAPYVMNGKWYMKRSTIEAISKLKDSQNQYLWSPGLQAGEPQNLLAHPIVRFEDMPAVAADALAIVFGDMRQAYTIVDRAGVRVLRDPFTSKPFVLFYTTKRVGGGVVNHEAIKIQKIAA